MDQLGTSPTETLQNDLDKPAQWGMQFHPYTGLSTLSKVGGYFEKSRGRTASEVRLNNVGQGSVGHQGPQKL
jgi:hypothetical protein